eukprot:CAMPEP_0197844718 /NCGR_PEP_ID=MMETSP1438-20131217/1700_1 /TAXON_ID=1461541 /ORGANISM="Pterosperma sp., Strain CCMP1384" /LENGTH=95 /DNA_ID=CAMNT_0043455659 /DNA_START=225 /DNA_END=512 /DNA_ORIENTATION=+
MVTESLSWGAKPAPEYEDNFNDDEVTSCFTSEYDTRDKVLVPKTHIRKVNGRRVLTQEFEEGLKALINDKYEIYSGRTEDILAAYNVQQSMKTKP